MMGKHHHPGSGSQPLPLALLAQAIPMLSRNDLEALTERLIDVLDDMDGDTEREDDDQDTSVEDEGCDDINDDREEEEGAVPDYGIDQTDYWKRGH